VLNILLLHILRKLYLVVSGFETIIAQMVQFLFLFVLFLIKSMQSLYQFQNWLKNSLNFIFIVSFCTISPLNSF